MFFALHSTPLESKISWMGMPRIGNIGYFYIAILGFPPIISGWVLIALFLVLSASAVMYAIRRKEVSHSALLFGSVASIPPLLDFAVAHATGLSIWAPRQLMISGIAFVALLIIAMQYLPKNFALLVASILVIWAIAGSGDAFPWNSKPGWKAVVAKTQSTGKGLPFVCQENWVAEGLVYYAKSSPVIEVDNSATRAIVLKGNVPFYFVCRPRRCSLLERLELVHGPATVFSSHRWNTIGRVPRAILLTYKFGGRGTYR